MTKLQLNALKTFQLDPIDLTLTTGERISISGDSGSGKTQLLRAIADLDEHQGTVELNGKPCESFTGPQWRRLVALLPASPLWWHTSVGEHFDTVSDEQLKALGFDTKVLTWQVDRLSSGEQQRLALARLLSRAPSVLLLDEPTANLDAENAQKVETLIKNYCTNNHAAAIWISHDPKQQQRIATRHYRIENGELKKL